MPDIDPHLPGAELVRKGLEDLAQRRTTKEASLIKIAAPRLAELGFAVERVPPSEEPELALFQWLNEENGATALRAYNALIQRIASFARASVRAGGGRPR